MPQFSAAGRCTCRATLAILACAVATASAAAIRIEPRRGPLTGDAAPGTGPGVVFSSFESPFNQSFPVPLMDDADHVLFFAFLAGPGVLPGDHGLWVHRGRATSLLARVGDPAPGAGPDVVFQGLPNTEIPLGFQAGGGATAFPATLAGPGVDLSNDDGIWSDASGALELMVRESDPVPGAAGVTFGIPGLHSFTHAHESLFFARLQGGPVTPLDDETVWSHAGATLTLRAREGDPAPGTEPGVVFGDGGLGSVPGTFPFADFNDAGRLLLRADLEGPGVGVFSDEALFSDRDGELALILREGDQVPGAPDGITFGGDSVALALDYPLMNDLGHVAFNVRLGGIIPTTTALFSDHLGSLRLIARPGQPAPGTGERFTVFGSPVLSDAGRLAFAGSTDVGFFPQSGIFWDQRGQLEPLILPGDPIPDRPGATFGGASFIDGFTASGLLALRGGIETPAGPQSALLVGDAEGAIATVVASGDTIDVDGKGDRRTVALIFPGTLNENGVLVVRLNFTDGSSGLFGAIASSE